MKIKKIKLNAKNINKIIWSVAAAAGVFYIVSVNSLSIQGYELRDAKQKINYLTSQNSDNEAKIMSLESLSSISDRMQKMKLVKADNVQYITSAMEVVARR